MADINFNFGTEDLNELQKLLKEFVRISEKIRADIGKHEIVSEDDELRMKAIEVAALKISNEKKKQERTSEKLAQQEKGQADKMKEQSGLIGGLEQKVKEYTKAWKGANTEAERKQAKRQLDETKKSLQQAKGITDSWTKALGSFQFKFNALGNIASNVLQGMTNRIKSVVTEFTSFDKIINSTQASGDKFAEIIGALKGGFLALNLAVASGDWSNFFKRFRDASEAGRDFIRALDEIGDQERSVILTNQDLQAEIENLKLEIIKADKYTIEERTKMADEAIAKEKQILENEKSIIHDKIKAYTDNFATLTNLTAEEQENFLRTYKTNQDAYGGMLKDRERLEKAVAEQIDTVYQTTYGGIQIPVQKLKEGHESAVKALQDFNNQAGKTEGFEEWVNMLQRSNLFSDEQRIQLTELLKQLGVAEAASASGMKRLESQYQSLLKQADKIKETKGLIKINNTEIDELTELLIEPLGAYKEARDRTFSEDIIYRKEWAEKVREEMRKMNQDEIDAELEKQRGISAIRTAAGVFQNQLFGALQTANSAKLEKELENEKLTEEEKAKLKLHYARRGQNIAIAESFIALAQGIANVWKEWGANPPVAIALSALVAASAGAQIATIKAQKFEKGGEIGGRLHSQGGTIIEGERGEFVVNRRAFAHNRQLVEAINDNDQLRIMEALSMDKKVSGKTDANYTKKLYELLSSQENGYETNEFYVVQKGNMKFKIRKN